MEEQVLSIQMSSKPTHQYVQAAYSIFSTAQLQSARAASQHVKCCGVLKVFGYSSCAHTQLMPLSYSRKYVRYLNGFSHPFNQLEGREQGSAAQGHYLAVMFSQL